MTPDKPQELLDQASEWNDLHRWEKSQLGKELRSLGLTYTEIQAVIPVPRGTLSNWSRDVTLTSDQIDAIKQRTGAHTQRDIPKDSQWRRRLEIEAIRTEARGFAETHLHDPVFVGGVVLYWGEGAKTRNYLDLTNTDPAALRYFINWVREYLDPEEVFKLGLHLHEGNNEELAKQYWTDVLDLKKTPFDKTFIEPRGTGHRKNRYIHGVCRVRTLRASNHWNRVMVWIDVVADAFGR